MALANSAVSLALKGRRVLLVDFDIEAPGLDTFAVMRPKKQIPGIIEFVSRYMATGESPDVSDYIAECRGHKDHEMDLWIMPAGKRKNYSANLHQIDWGELYDRRQGYLLFEDLKAQWAKRLKPDYVFLDSRTGHTDTSGICTRQLPDAVVVLFFPNKQNLRGLTDAVSGIRAEAEGVRKKKIDLHFVMSNVPDLDDEERILESIIENFRSELDIQDKLNIVHRYDSLSLLNQTLFSLHRPNSRLAHEYDKVVSEIIINNWRDRDGALEYIRGASRKSQLMRRRPKRLQEQFETFDKIRLTHQSDGEVLFRLAEFYKFHDWETALSIMNAAAEAGHEDPNLFLMRSRIHEANQNEDLAQEDIWRVLNFEDVSPVIVTEAVARLSSLNQTDPEKIIRRSAVSSLPLEYKLWMTSRFNRSKRQLQFSLKLLEQILAENDISDKNRTHAESEMGLALIGLRHFSDAMDLYEPKEKDLSDLSIEDLFNYAMACWGSTHEVRSDIFQHVLNRWQSISQNSESPNKYQCISLAYWAVGNANKASEYVEKAKIAINGYRDTAEFSCWQYLKVKKAEFLRDLDEIISLIEKNDPPLPRFIRCS